MYIEQTKPHLIDSLLYCSLFIALVCFNASTSSSGSSHLVPAKLHKRVHAVLVFFFLKNFHIRSLESLNIKNLLAIINYVVVTILGNFLR
jgi:hypothetical protein